MHTTVHYTCLDNLYYKNYKVADIIHFNHKQAHRSGIQDMNTDSL